MVLLRMVVKKDVISMDVLVLFVNLWFFGKDRLVMSIEMVNLMFVNIVIVMMLCYIIL